MPLKTLSQVLQIRPGQRVSLLGVRDADFLRQHLAQVANPAQHRAAMGSDVIVLAVEGPMQLRRVAPLQKYLSPGGVLWLLYRSSDAELVMRSIAAAGLTAVESVECVVSSGRRESGERIAVCVSPPAA